ncbi:MAG: DUF11 domain-containing protein [Planctomycetota bacterium]|nr:MAG: DUF11 domain-containing protein [Planctomycetota bacterium]
MRGMNLKAFGAMIVAAAVLVGAGCQSQEARTSDDTSIERVAVGLDGAQPDPWWEPRRPDRQARERAAEPVERPAEPAPVVRDGRGSVSAAYPTGDARTSAILVEKFFPLTVNAGQPFDYEIRVTNLTSLDLDNVQVWDSIPSNFKLISADPNVDSASNNNLMWMLGSMGPGEIKTIKVRGSAPAEGVVTACSKVAYDTSLCNEIKVVKPALELAVNVTPEVTICDPIQITYTVCNRGTGPAENVVVRKTLPEGLTVNGSRELRFNVARLGPGECKDFTVAAKAARTGTYAVDGSASADGDLSASAEPRRSVVRQPVLAIEVECPGRIMAGQTVPQATISLTVQNTGDAVSNDTVIEAPVPAGSTFVSATDGGANAGGTVRWNIGALAAGASRTVQFTVQPDGHGSLNAVGRVAGACANAADDSCQVEVLGIPAVLLEVIDVEDPVRVGTTVTYRISVTNQGSARDTNIKVVATLEDEAEFVGAVGQHTVRGKTIEFAPVPVLNAKERITFEVVVRAVKPGDTRFTVTLDTDELSREVRETEATNFYE